MITHAASRKHYYTVLLDRSEWWYLFDFGVYKIFSINFPKNCDQRQKNRTYGVKGRVDLSAGG